MRIESPDAGRKEVNVVKVLTQDSKELMSLSLVVEGDREADGGTLCQPTTTLGGYRIQGPDVGISISKDANGNGLVVSTRLPELIGMDILIEQDDIKALKSLMNKDAMGFMVKAFIR